MKILLIFLLFLMGWPAYSQPAAHYPVVADPDNEQIFVQINSTFLITGETLLFKVFCKQRKNGKPSVLSKVAYLELVDEQGTPVFQTKIWLENGTGNGDAFIPSTFITGNYTLIAYTRWMRNFATNSFFRNEITIVNPFRQATTISTTGKVSIHRENTGADTHSNTVQLKLSRNKFKPREKVSLALSSGKEAVVAISVRKKEPGTDDSGTILAYVRPGDAPSSTPKKKYLPEIRGHVITGKLTPKGDAAPKGIILASIPGSDFIFRAAASDEQGNFTIVVDHIPNSAVMQFQIQDGDINNYTLTLDDPFLGDYSGFRPTHFVNDSALRKIIDERNIYVQIENAYYSVKKDSVPLTPAASFYYPPDKTYRMDDFTRFPTMEDIFREYIPEVILKNAGGTFSLRILRPVLGDLAPKEPLILVDGLPILNTNTLMAFDPLKVERIEIIKSKYFYGSLDIDGLVSVRTYNSTAEDLPVINSHRENLVKIQPGKAYFFPDYSIDKNRMERIPDYRLQLYWNPNLVVMQESAAIVQFYTSDLPGDFEILVEGFTSNGELISERDVITVEK